MQMRSKFCELQHRADFKTLNEYEGSFAAPISSYMQIYMQTGPASVVNVPLLEKKPPAPVAGIRKNQE